MSDLEEFGLTPDELAELRLAAENVYSTFQGKQVFDELFEDLWLYEEPKDEYSMMLHRFAMRVMRKYFGKLLPVRTHRSALTDAIMKVATPVAEEKE